MAVAVQTLRAGQFPWQVQSKAKMEIQAAKGQELRPRRDEFIVDT